MDPILAQIILWPGSWIPEGWLACNGQLLPVNQYQALFSLLGTIYGGNGTTNFGLPNLQGRVPIGVGQGAGGSLYQVGQIGGVESVALSIPQMPIHNHTATGTISGGTASATLPAINSTGVLSVSANAGVTNTPSATNVPASVPPIQVSSSVSKPVNSYGVADAVTKWPVTVTTAYVGGNNLNVQVSGLTLGPITVSVNGGGLPHENRMPFQAMNYIIATTGIYPTRP